MEKSIERANIGGDYTLGPWLIAASHHMADLSMMNTRWHVYADAPALSALTPDAPKELWRTRSISIHIMSP
jgi:hypothetical protein